MRKHILTMLIVVALAGNAGATLPVVDYSHIAQDAGNEVVNLAKWAKTEVDAAQTQLNTLNTYENTVLQVARFGNPAALRSLPGISTIAQLLESGQQVMREYQHIRAMTSPQYLQGNLSSLTSVYGLQQWNPLSPGAYQFPSASYAVSQSVQDQIMALEQQRQRLEQQRDQALQSLQGATTASDMEKYKGVLSGLNGAIAEVAARANEFAQKSQLQQQQLQAGQAVFHQQTTESSAASFSSDVNSSIGRLESLSTDFGSIPHWSQ
jgi:hypothetical protein